jgi:hypothetical protein
MKGKERMCRGRSLDVHTPPPHKKMHSSEPHLSSAGRHLFCRHSLHGLARRGAREDTGTNVSVNRRGTFNVFPPCYSFDCPREKDEKGKGNVNAIMQISSKRDPGESGGSSRGVERRAKRPLSPASRPNVEEENRLKRGRSVAG